MSGPSIRRVVFAGTPDFAAQALKAIVAAGFEVAAVLTQPDRPGGRGMKLQASAVKQAAQALGLTVWQPENLKDASVQAALIALAPDVMVVAAYGLILPQAVLDIPRFGCLNIHASLLPRWRGAAPIQWAIASGDTETGVCIMQMDAGLDTGAVYRRESCAIAATDTAATLLATLTDLGANSCVAALQQLPTLTAVPQSHEGATYAPKLTRALAKIDWTQPAAVIERRVRAFNPIPAAWTTWRDEPLKIWRAQEAASDERSLPGQIIQISGDSIIVVAGEGALKILEVQRPGAKRMPVAQFLLSHALTPGERLT